MPGRGERNIAWIEATCRVPEGAMVGQPVRLREWQKEIIRGIYGSPTRRAIISFGRKNGKTALAAFLCLLHLCGPEYRRNSSIYSAGRSRDQAALLFGLAAKCVQQSPQLVGYVVVKHTAKQLFCPGTGGVYKAMSADASTTIGGSPALAIHDEVGQVKGPRSDLYDAIETGMSAHDQPLSILISTQAATDADLLSVKIDDAKRGEDPKTKLFLYTASEDLDPFSEEAIRAANPAFGDFQSAEEVLGQAAAAKRMPTSEASYRNLILNQRVNTSTPFISRSVWTANGGEPRPLSGAVYGGLDLSGSRDLTALILLSKSDAVDVHPYFWLPEEGLADKARDDRAPYDLWRDEGFLLTTPGKTIQYEFLAAHLREVFGAFDVRKVAFDPWKMQILRPLLQQAGFSEDELERFEPVQQTYKFMSPYLRETESALIDERLRHGGHPVLTMCAQNATVKEGRVTGDRLLAKPSAAERIDGMVALAMALGVMAADMGTGGPSVYEKRGLLVF